MAEGLSILWLLDLQPGYGLLHGATMRWLRFARELRALGHNVVLSANEDIEGDLGAKTALLETYLRQGWFSAVESTSYRFPAVEGRRAHLLAHPALTNRVLARFQAETTRRVEAMVRSRDVDVLVISQRRLLFLAETLRPLVPVVVDWMDSLLLHEARQTRSFLRRGRWRQAAYSLKRTVQAAIQERYYGRRTAANIVVSPRDFAAFQAVAGRRRRNHVLLNGVEAFGERPRPERIPGRIVFSGAMDAPQNHEAALWFIREVLPLIRREDPSAHFLVAGRDPQPELIACAGPWVRLTGAVEDLAGEIARSAVAVAPLRSGCGFKNKVVESLAAGTFVVGTRMGVEFLQEDIRSRLLIADSPRGLAQHVLRVLAAPLEFEAGARGLQHQISQEFNWRRRAQDLVEILHPVAAPKRLPVAPLSFAT